MADLAARALGVTLVRRSAEQAPWHPGRCAEIATSDGVLLGYAGELHPQVIAAYGLPERTAAVEIDLSALLAAAPPRGSVAPISAYPVAKEDVALIVGGGRTGGDRRVGPAARGRTAAGVGRAVRRLHRSAGRRGTQVAGLRPAVPGAGSHPHRRRERRRAGRGGRCGRDGGRSRAPGALALGTSGRRSRSFLTRRCAVSDSPVTSRRRVGSWVRRC